MEQTNKVSDQGNEPEEEKEPVIFIRLKPGVSSQKSAVIQLPAEKINDSIEDVIDYVVGRPEMSPKNRRVIDSVKSEMRSNYGITVNNKVVNGEERVVDYLVNKKSSSGLDYKELEIIVASEQSGGLRYNCFNYAEL